MISLVFITLMTISRSLYAQPFKSPLLHDSGYRQQPIDTFYPKKKFWRGSGELFLTELIPWSYNYFVRDAEFAHISFESIWTNLQPANWEWDDNNFKTNQFAHPYHGNLYFNSFRTNGYSFWQSVPAAFAGSFIWEVAGETHYPAPNDFINTSLGGISLGEMTYRLANRIVNNRQRGFKRQVQEVFALLLNPVNGLNRILDGRWGKVHYTPMDSTKARITGMLDAGARRISTRTNDILEKGGNEFYFRLRLQYGDLYTASRTAFNNFSINVEAGNDDSSFLNVVSVNGALGQWEISESSTNRHLYGVSMNYDYFHNRAFEYGGQSFHFKLLSQWNRQRPVKYTTNVGMGLIVLAAVPDEYLYYGEGRNYDFGPGVGIHAGGAMDIKGKLACALNYRGGWFKTVNGNESSFFLNAASLEVKYLFHPSFSVGMELGHFSLNGYYADYDDVFKEYPFIKIAFGYKFLNE